MKKYNIKVTACVNELNTLNSMPSFKTLNKNYIIEAKDKEDAKQKGREKFIAETLYKGSIYGEYTGERRVAPFMEGFADDHPAKYEDITKRDYFVYRWQINVFVKQYRKPRTKPEAEATAETTEATAQTTETTEATAETTEATAQTTETTEATAETTAETTEATAETTAQTTEATAETTAETTEATAETTEETAPPTETEQLPETAPPTETEQLPETPPPTEETEQPPETPPPTETEQPIYGPLITKNITFSDAFHRATKSTPPPPIISTGKEVTGVTIREHRQYNNGIEKIIVHKGFYNFDELISWYQHNDPSFLCTYKGILFGCDNIDYYAASFIYESEYL